MSTDPKKEFKDMLNELFAHLKKENGTSGIPIFGIGGLSNKDNIEKEVESILKLIGARGMPTGQMNQDNGPRDFKVTNEKCFCPNCFNFDTFEEVLKDFGGTFDHTGVSLGGKLFDIKYWCSPDGKMEKVIVAPHKEKEKVYDYAGLSNEKLQELLNTAVTSKNFTEAQNILDIINKTKNKN